MITTKHISPVRFNSTFYRDVESSISRIHLFRKLNSNYKRKKNSSNGVAILSPLVIFHPLVVFNRPVVFKQIVVFDPPVVSNPLEGAGARLVQNTSGLARTPPQCLERERARTNATSIPRTRAGSHERLPEFKM